jgi:ryanodine receptor 2
VWYTIQLLQITTKSQLLYNVVLAVVVNGPSLILTLLLMLIVIFIFATVSFYNFSEKFDPFARGDNRFHCNSLFNCWVVHVDSIRAGGGIGDYLNNNWGNPATGVGYDVVFFQQVFFFLVILINVNIFFGIIVDSFGQLREGREFINRDQTCKCFICGIDQNEFDKTVPGGFELHIKNEHNMWSYLMFMHHISKKDPSTLNGQEAFVAACMSRKETAFFPLGKAMMLPATLADDGRTEFEDEDEASPASPDQHVKGISSSTGDAILEKLDSALGRLEKLERCLSEAAQREGQK